jgi:hypothetical protein
MTMGINLGPMLLAIENYRTRQIWNLTANSPEVVAGLDRIFGLGSPETVVSLDQSGERNQVIIQWKPEPAASEYSIFASAESDNWNLVASGVKATSWTNANLGKKSDWSFRVKAIREIPPRVAAGQ